VLQENRGKQENCPLCAKKKECNCIEEIQPNLILETLITKFD